MAGVFFGGELIGPLRICQEAGRSVLPGGISYMDW